MPDHAPEPAADSGAGSPRAMVAGTLTLVAAFAVSSSPVPLFNHYRAAEGLTNADMALAVVAYFAGTVGALLVLGRLANHVGRRPMAAAALACLIAGALVLTGVDGEAPLVLGRFLMGVGCGIASSAVMAYVVDAAPARPAWLATAVTSQSPMLGLTLGALGSGVLVEHGPRPALTVYLVGVGVLVLCLVAIGLAPETAERSLGALASLRPRVTLPAGARALVPVALVVFVATWATGAFYQSFGPSVVQDGLGTGDAVVVALVFSAYMLPSVLGAPIGGRFAVPRAQRLGITVFLVGMAGILTSLHLGTVPGFLLASMVAGTGQGMAVSATIRGIMGHAGPAERAPTMAAIYLMSYLGAMVPSLISGQLSRVLSVEQIALGYGGLALLAALVTWWRAGADRSSAATR